MHIPKTAGRYITYFVIEPIRDQLEKNNIKIINSNMLTHLNWHSEIDDQTYVITNLRDPASQIISLYVHKKTTKTSGRLITSIDFELQKKDFYNTILNNDNYKNFQSKSFMMNELDIFGLEGNSAVIDQQLLEKRLKKVNLLLNVNNLQKNAIKIQEKIFLDLGIDGSTKISEPNLIMFNPFSEYLYNKFSYAEKNSLREYNSIDKNIYENSQYYLL
jgi:hypothetical protein